MDARFRIFDALYGPEPEMENRERNQIPKPEHGEAGFDRTTAGPTITSASGPAPMIGETPEWAFWAVVGLLALMMLLPTIKR